MYHRTTNDTAAVSAVSLLREIGMVSTASAQLAIVRKYLRIVYDRGYEAGMEAAQTEKKDVDEEVINRRYLTTARRR